MLCFCCTSKWISYTYTYISSLLLLPLLPSHFWKSSQSTVLSCCLCCTWSCIYWRRQRHPTPVLLPGQSHGRRSLVGCSPWGRTESGTTERLHFQFSLSCTGEGNGSPLQCSCLEDPRDGGAWWAAVYGVTQIWTRLKWLSSSSSYLILVIRVLRFLSY